MRIEPLHWNMAILEEGLSVEGCNLIDLASQYGTPLFVVDETRLRENCHRLLRSLSKFYPESRCFFSYKTNQIPGILRIIKEEGLGAEIISEFELGLAEMIGNKPDDIIFDGIWKTPALFERLIKKGVRLINIDDDSDVGVLNEVAGNYRRRVDIGVRVNVRRGWGWNPFGIDEGRIVEVFKRLSGCENLNPVGLMVHSSPRAADPYDYVNKARFLLDICLRLKKEIGLDIKHIDIGGGYGSASVRRLGNLEHLLNIMVGMELSPPDTRKFVPIDKAMEAVSYEIKRFCREKGIRPPILHVEPGTSIIEDAQFLLARVSNVKTIAGKAVAVTDASRINIAQPLKGEYHELFVANKMNELPEKRYKIVGRLCSPHDWLYQKKRLPEVETGDVLAIMDTGAYFNSTSNNFSFPMPAVVSVSQGISRLLRKAESFEHIKGLDNV